MPSDCQWLCKQEYSQISNETRKKGEKKTKKTEKRHTHEKLLNEGDCLVVAYSRIRFIARSFCMLPPRFVYVLSSVNLCQD